MGRVNKEYKFNHLKGLNTLIDKYGLDKGEAYFANNIFFKEYGDKIIAEGRPRITSFISTLPNSKVISMGSISKGTVGSAYYDGLLFLHYENGNMDTIDSSTSNTLATVNSNTLTKLPTSTLALQSPNKCVSLTYTELNNLQFLTAPRISRTINKCNTLTDWSNYGAESGAISLDIDTVTQSTSSIKTVVTNSNATENGVYLDTSIDTTLSCYIDLNLSDITNIANVRVRIYTDQTDTNGMYWDITEQVGGQDLITGWNTIKVDIDDGTGTIIGAGLGASTSTGRVKVGAITSSNDTYDLYVGYINFANQTSGLHQSYNGIAWEQVTKSSETLPPFSRVTTWDGRVFGIYNNRLYWSNINDGTDFWNAIDTENKAGSTNSNTTIDNLGSTINLKVGLRVSDSAGDIPSGAVITSIDSTTAITISEAAIGTTSSNLITFQGAASDDSNWMELDDGDGDLLTHVSPLSNNMLIAFKNTSLHRIKINTTASASTIPYIREPVFSGENQSGIGCKSPNSVQSILIDGVQNEVWGSAEYLVFYSGKHIYAIGSVGGPIKLTEKISEFPDFVDSVSFPGDERAIFSVIDVYHNTYIIYSFTSKYGYAYSIRAKKWSKFTTGLELSAAINVTVVGDINSTGAAQRNFTFFGADNSTSLLYLDTSNGYYTTDLGDKAFTSIIKYSMYDYGRERFYKLLQNSSSILSTLDDFSPNTIDIVSENESGDKSTTTITPTTTPTFYDTVCKLYGTHISQQYDLTGGGVVHRFIHEIKHTNNKKGA